MKWRSILVVQLSCVSSAFAASERNDQVLVIYLGVDAGNRSSAILALNEYSAILFTLWIESSSPISGPGHISSN